MDQVQALLQKLKINYLAELPERLDRLENLILALERDGYSQEHYHELYRQIHSLKGSGGTYGIHVITSICHPFEDFLNEIDERSDLQACAFANVSLTYLDILRQVVAAIRLKPDTVFDVDKLLAAVRRLSAQPKYRALLVENSATVVKMVSRILQNNHFSVAVQDDGYLALGRLLVESFDLLVSAQEVKQLNGCALIAALRTNQGATGGIKTVLLTANSAFQAPPVKPDYILNKNDQLSSRLQTVLTALNFRQEAKT